MSPTSPPGFVAALTTVHWPRRTRRINSMNVFLVDSRSADTAETGALALFILFATSPPPLPGPASYRRIPYRPEVNLTLVILSISLITTVLLPPMYPVGGGKGRPGSGYVKGLWSGAQDDYSANDDERGAAEPR